MKVFYSAALLTILCFQQSFAQENGYQNAMNKLLEKQMLLIDGGSFEMGNADGMPDAQPEHAAKISAFYMDVNEVSVADYRFFCSQTNYISLAEKNNFSFAYNEKNKWGKQEGLSWKNPGFEQDETHPVIHMSWFDCVEYANWRSQLHGFKACYKIEGDNVTCDYSADGFRLPTEAEWEYAASGKGTEKEIDWSKNVGNVADEAALKKFKNWSIKDGYNDGQVYTAPCGSYLPNSLQLHDMLGNAWEWCNDWFGEDYYATADANNPKGPVSGDRRAMRGGSWDSVVFSPSMTDRSRNKPDYSFYSSGFRLVRKK